MRGHTKSLDANDKLIQTRSHVRNAIASRERQVVMRKVKSTIHLPGGEISFVKHLEKVLSRTGNWKVARGKPEKLFIMCSWQRHNCQVTREFTWAFCIKVLALKRNLIRKGEKALIIHWRVSHVSIQWIRRNLNWPVTKCCNLQHTNTWQQGARTSKTFSFAQKVRFRDNPHYTEEFRENLALSKLA